MKLHLDHYSSYKNEQVRHSGNKILVPYQFNKASEYALEAGIDLALSMQGQLTLCHVAEIASYHNFNAKVAESYMRELINFLQVKMQGLIKKWVPEDLVADQKVVIGNPAREIVNLTNQGDHQMVVMGYQTSLTPRHKITGSNVERVIRFSNIPVLTVREPTASSDIGDIVFATDFKQIPSYVVQQLTKFQTAMEANLRIVRINTRENWVSSRDAESLMDEFRRRHHLANFEFETYDDLTPETGIINYAHHIHAGTIAMGIQSFTRLDTLVHHHHIAEDLVKTAHQLMWTCAM